MTGYEHGAPNFFFNTHNTHVHFTTTYEVTCNPTLIFSTISTHDNT